MRYAIFTDIHANLEALEAVLARIDELAKEQPIDQIWFLGDLVGYGPNPNECIETLRKRTDVIIAGNHDWAAVGKIDLEEFSEAARISAEWTRDQLTDEHFEFLAELPERLQMGACTLVHGSPYGPLWEYLTSEVLAERSFQHFDTRYCIVGHTHVPIIFQQPDTYATTPTVPLTGEQEVQALVDNIAAEAEVQAADSLTEEDDDDTAEMVAVRPAQQQSAQAAPSEDVAHVAPHLEQQPGLLESDAEQAPESGDEDISLEDDTEGDEEQERDLAEDALVGEETQELEKEADVLEEMDEEESHGERVTSEADILSAEDSLNQEIEELLALLGLSQSMVEVTNDMIVPPEGNWKAPAGYRAIVNPGGVGQPRDGDPRAAFMIYDTERGFTFYRVDYDFKKTQEKIEKAGLPPYLATRLAYGR
ncbi:metallophosphoesterase family protein [Ktedonobacter racemifer]|uniref:Metallophosphoesterase n=1 Tax=Ktedonobacter racemifer DSM 44963 TaxID=485913 RepID=D6TKL1_KTERA|nr:metallophosphoesterase family protein [Ktedonobacter racemifer]EFH86311.1 metallophosphoesterase [Ktedonobacter racemifer DSM 44963]